MNVIKTNRGFEVLLHPVYPPLSEEKEARLVQQSSLVGDYEDAWGRPGSSALWVGIDHHLNREEVTKLVEHLNAWLKTGSLALE